MSASPATNIKVIVRCRPLSESELKGRHCSVVTCQPKERQIEICSEVRGQDVKKVYTFDSVFGEFSQQETVFGEISAIVDEVLQGFNCTVFAYGQTGTGKTYTMSGTDSDMEGSMASSGCGIIPRSIHAIFQRLGDKEVNECVIHVSCLEIYNEEIFDLLSDNTEVDHRIFDDAVKGVFVSNLEEILVADPSDIFAVLRRSWERRRTAETKMNMQSSRSHTIFSVKVHTKETTVDGEEIIKIGKLNLVDLAGSECIGKSEASGARAKETGNINRSLLTLGRVINSLVQGQRHVPYRESKLTRLLQESLGGRAKTILIATVSPSNRSMEETMKTLEYAHTAKNILNRPEVNQKVTQKAFVRDLQIHIAEYKKQLEAARTKSGVYLPTEQYNSMEDELRRSKDKVDEQERALEQAKGELAILSTSNGALREELITVRRENSANEAALISAHEGVVSRLDATIAELQSDIDEANNTIQSLHHAVMNRQSSIKANFSSLLSLSSSQSRSLSSLRAEVDRFVTAQSTGAEHVTAASEDLARCLQDTLQQAAAQVDQKSVGVSSGLMTCTDLISDLCAPSRITTVSQATIRRVELGLNQVEVLSGIITSETNTCLTSIHDYQQQMLLWSRSLQDSLTGTCSMMAKNAEIIREQIAILSQSVADVNGAQITAIEQVQERLVADHTQQTDHVHGKANQLIQTMTTLIGDFVCDLSRSTATSTDQLSSLLTQQIGSHRENHADISQMIEQANQTLQRAFDVSSGRIEAEVSGSKAHVEQVLNSSIDVASSHLTNIQGKFAHYHAQYDQVAAQEIRNVQQDAKRALEEVNTLGSQITSAMSDIHSEIRESRSDAIKLTDDCVLRLHDYQDGCRLWRDGAENHALIHRQAHNTLIDQMESNWKKHIPQTEDYCDQDGPITPYIVYNSGQNGTPSRSSVADLSRAAAAVRRDHPLSDQASQPTLKRPRFLGPVSAVDPDSVVLDTLSMDLEGEQ